MAHDARVPTDALHVCIDRQLPREFNLRALAETVALRENRRNYMPNTRDAYGTRAALDFGKQWQNGRTLRVRFLDGDPTAQDRVAALWPEWSEHANIRFQRSDDPDAEIRISFLQPGSWSYIGTDALMVPLHRPTMNFGWLTPTTPDAEYQRVVLHEFGHALGMIHEHQNPATTIPWNKEAVYAYYGGPPNYWSPQQVETNLFQTYDRTTTNFSEFDRDSIMLYPIPQALTLGEYEVGWNMELSEVDKAFMRRQYPFTQVSENQLVIDAPPHEADIGSAGEVDIYKIRVDETARYRIETQGRSDLVLSLFVENDRTTPLAEDDDSGTRLNPRIEQLLQPGEYTVQVRHFSPERTGTYSIRVQRTA